jgi:uncharacterized protein YndB with AHSA1/START domain
MSAVMTDRIEKKLLLRAPRARVWRALTDAAEFGKWFGVKLDGPFAPGALVRGVIVPTTVDADVAKAQKEYEGLPFEITIDRIEPEHLFSFRWHPFAVEPGVDYSREPMTLIVFALEDVTNGVMLTVTESGFDQIPLARRAKAFTANEQGWTMVVTLIEKYLPRPHSFKARAELEGSASIFAALGDETRLRLVSRLCDDGPMSIAKLTAGFAITRQAITKHLRVMEDAGLVRSTQHGRESIWQS